MKLLQFVNKFLLASFLFFTFSNIFAQTKDFTKYVNPFVGTGGHGHTFPGATVPFGMVQLSPDTRTDNWDGSSGYHYSDNVIYGFSHTHLSGTGIPDYCDILLMPTIGNSKIASESSEKNRYGFGSKFSHESEISEPGYYSVKLDDHNIRAEMTASKRVGFHRYSPNDGKVNVVLDLHWRDKVIESKLNVVSSNRVEGFRRSSSWAKNQIVYFVAEFSKPIDNIFSNSSKLSQGSEKWGITANFTFDVKTNEQILVKVAISPVSIEGARKNLQTEIPDWNFDKVRADAKNAWNKELSQIEVSGGTDDQLTTFYTALYHTKIQPNIFQDVDGNYLGLDKKIHNAPKDTNYTIFSLWDTFRAAHPLYTIIDQKRTADFINTFIRQYEQGGRLPVWELAGNETDTMIGYHAVSVIADAMAKGIKGFDYEKAFEAAKHSAELNHYGLEAYKRRGYISMEDEQESVSKTLEYAYDDFCIAQMAKILKEQKIERFKKGIGNPSQDVLYVKTKQFDYEKYLKRAQYYKNLYDKQTGFMRPKQNGNWISPFQPNEVTFHFTEGNSWVYSFFVPHDVGGLIDLYGGKTNFAAKLDELFTTEQKLTGREQPDITGLIGQYAHGNEPSHHIAYLYNYADEPWKTQKLVRKILDEFYKPTPDGLIGNEDCGQMSAWYILSALGFYEVAPSIPFYDFGTPIFKEVKINLENGKTFTIHAQNVSDKNIYIKSVKLNGKPYRKTFFAHADLISGGALEFEMSDAPVKDWFVESSVSPIAEKSAAVPVIVADSKTFTDRLEIKLAKNEPRAKIYYTLDGSLPDVKSNEYQDGFWIDKTTTVKTFTKNFSGEQSPVAEAVFYKIPHDWTVKVLSKYNRQYTGGGDFGLIDGIRGTLNFASGEWQGYQDQDFIAVIDLKKETEIHKLGGGFLQDARPWIWMPTRIEFETSNDGENFQKVAEIKTDVAVDDMKPQIKDYIQKITPVKARYVRVKAINLGKIPAWHPGAGYDAFIFVDEIFID